MRENKTVEHSDNYCLKDCFTIHMDILGSKNILSGPDEQIINFIRALEDLYEELRADAPSLNIKVYSDNIMLYTYDCSQSAFDDMVESAARMQMRCLTSHKLLIRGGMSDKKMFSNEIFSIGKGLVEAYTLESK